VRNLIFIGLFFSAVNSWAAETVLQCKSGTGTKLVELTVFVDGSATLKRDKDSCTLKAVAGRHLPMGQVPHIMMDFEKDSCKDPVIDHSRIKILLSGKKKNQGFFLWKKDSDATKCEVSKLQNDLLIEMFKKKNL
jgi:hypothetical protein